MVSSQSTEAVGASLATTEEKSLNRTTSLMLGAVGNRCQFRFVSRAHYFAGPSLVRSLPANLVRPPKPGSPRRTGRGGNTVNVLAVPRGQARQSGEPAFAAPLGYSDTPFPQLAAKAWHPAFGGESPSVVEGATSSATQTDTASVSSY